jgi:hypothetical protein
MTLQPQREFLEALVSEHTNENVKTDCISTSNASSVDMLPELPNSINRELHTRQLHSSFDERVNTLQNTIKRMSFASLK